MKHITSCRNITSVEHTASAVFGALWLVLLRRERKYFIQFSSEL